MVARGQQTSLSSGFPIRPALLQKHSVRSADGIRHRASLGSSSSRCQKSPFPLRWHSCLENSIQNPQCPHILPEPKLIAGDILRTVLRLGASGAFTGGTVAPVAHVAFGIRIISRCVVHERTNAWDSACLGSTIGPRRRCIRTLLFYRSR